MLHLPLLLNELPKQRLSLAAERTLSFRIKFLATIYHIFKTLKQPRSKFALGSILIAGEFFFLLTNSLLGKYMINKIKFEINVTPL